MARDGRPTITANERRALWGQVKVRMTALDELDRTFNKTEDWRDAERLGREFAGLLLLCDDLGWERETESDIALKSPPDALRRAFARLREMARVLRSMSEGEAEEVSKEVREARSLEETCERVLEELEAGESAQVGAAR